MRRGMRRVRLVTLSPIDDNTDAEYLARADGDHAILTRVLRFLVGAPPPSAHEGEVAKWDTSDYFVRAGAERV